MKKFRTVSFCLFLILLLLTGCKQQDQSLDLAICGSYAAPGMFCYELKGGTFFCEVLETDSQGRILFSYTTQNVITGAEETAFVICQAFDAQYVYFYEDRCYLLGTKTASETALLKEQNDWNSSLNYSKMARRPNALSMDLFIVTDNQLEYKEVKTVCCSTLNIQETQLKELCLLDIDPKNQVLYWLVVEKESSVESYYVIVNASYGIALMNVIGDTICPTEISSFKQNNGWDYGVG